MMCFHDMTFCSDANECNNKTTCHRYFSKSLEQEALHWWGKEGYPVAYSSFKDTCPKYELHIPIKKTI